MPVPSWLTGANLDEWIEIPLTQSLTAALSGIEGTYPGSADVQSLVEAWSRGDLVTIGGNIYLALCAGGHLDGAYNGIVLIGPINSDNPTAAIAAGSASAAGDVVANSNYYSDGKPTSDHGYGLSAFLPTQNQFLKTGIAAAYGGSANNYRTFDAFDFDTDTWDTTSYDNSPSTGNGQEGGAVYDYVNDRVLLYEGKSSFPYDRLRGFNPAAAPGTQWSQLSASNAGPYSVASALAYDGSRNHVLFLDANADRFFLFNNIGNTSLGPQQITLSGDTGIQALTRVGLIYNHDLDRYIAYRGDTGDTKSIYIIDPTPADGGSPSYTWPCTKVTPAGGETPVRGSEGGEGIFGRFRYVSTADFRGYVMYMDYDGKVLFYPTWINSAVQINITDTATGNDAIGSISVGLSVSDTANGTDNPPAPNVSFSLSDTASGNDQQSIAAQLGITDSGNAIDQQAISAQLSVADSATGNDAQSIAVTLTVNDSATGIDTPAIIVSLSVIDTGAGSDAVSLTGSTLVTINDIATALDAVASVTVGAQVSDTGAAVDQVNIAASLTVTDLGAGNDVVNVVTQLIKTILDSATANDSIAITASLQISDTALGSDTLAIANLLQVIDSAQGIDAVVQFDTTSRITTITFKLLKRRIKFQLLQ